MATKDEDATEIRNEKAEGKFFIVINLTISIAAMAAAYNFSQPNIMELNIYEEILFLTSVWIVITVLCAVVFRNRLHLVKSALLFAAGIMWLSLAGYLVVIVNDVRGMIFLLLAAVSLLMWHFSGKR